MKIMEVKFRGFYSKADVYHAVFLANRPPARKTRMRTGIAAIALVVYVAYVVYSAYKAHSPVLEMQSLGSHILILILLGVFLWYPKLISWITALKIWRAPTFHKEFSGMISEAGIQYDGKKTIITWQQIARNQSTEDMIVLLTSNGILSFFPRGFFRSAGDWQRAIQTVEGELSKIQ